MKVIVYEPDYNESHRAVLRAFAGGIPGAEVRPVTKPEPCDVAVIFGGVKREFKKTWSKRRIIDQQIDASGRLIMVESGFFNRDEYYQIGWSFGGAAGHADFAIDDRQPVDRFRAMNPPIKSWNTNRDGQIVVCGQLPRDVQVQDVDHVGWCRDTVDHYRRAGLDVVFRPHPMTDKSVYAMPSGTIIQDVPLDHAVKSARCFVTWNSTTAVNSVIAGVPTIAMDDGSRAWDVTSHDLDDLDHITNRDPWLAGLGYSQWTKQEMRLGLPWKHLTRDLTP